VAAGLDPQGQQQPPLVFVPGQGGTVPPDLRPDQYFLGTPWRGADGITERVADLIARDAAVPRARPLREARELDRDTDNKAPNPDAPAVAAWPPFGALMAPPAGHVPPQLLTVSTSWTGTHASESGYVPPDSIGAVGPTQVLVLSNGIFKVFDKAGTLGGLDLTDDTFFSSVRNGSNVSDPHVRYDRLSGRWFISEINVASTSNRVLIAVSSGSAITDSSSFTFYQFQHDTVGTTPNLDTGGFADYDTLGVDANALYIGINEFGGGGSSTNFNTTAYVINKANLLAGTLTVTAFRGLCGSSSSVQPGPGSPQGVDNDDPAATEGYVIGPDQSTYSRLQIRRITSPGGTPAISGNIALTVPTTYAPINQVEPGTTRTLDGLDDRLFAAMIRKNTLTGTSSLWTAHNIRVSSGGVASSSGTQNAVRWYQIDNLTTTPTLTQSGTVFDSSASNPRGYWMGAVAANGQGHMALVASFAGAADYAGVAVTGRLSSDTLGTTQTPSIVVTGAGPYVDWSTHANQRWGDYAQVEVDPSDNQTMWAFEDYAYSTSTTDAWGVRAVKLVAPPPATPSSASPSGIPGNTASTSVTITGTASGGSGFYDPGAAFPSRLAVSVSGGVVVNSVTFTSATSLTINVSTVGATSGAKNVTITNPDGQQVTGVGLVNVNGPTVSSVSPASGWTGGGTKLTVTGGNFVVGATTVMVGGLAATNVSVASTTSLTAVTPAQSAGSVAVSATTSNGTGSLANGFTYFVSLFHDDPLQSNFTAVKAVHVTEMRSYIDSLRSRYSLPAFSWSDPGLSAGTTRIMATHITELRTALGAVYTAANRQQPTYSSIGVGTPITTTFITEIRAAINAIY
jgi:hypothetical protein